MINSLYFDGDSMELTEKNSELKNQLNDYLDKLVNKVALNQEQLHIDNLERFDESREIKRILSYELFSSIYQYPFASGFWDGMQPSDLLFWILRRCDTDGVTSTVDYLFDFLNNDTFTMFEITVIAGLDVKIPFNFHNIKIIPQTKTEPHINNYLKNLTHINRHKNESNTYSVAYFKYKVNINERTKFYNDENVEENRRDLEIIISSMSILNPKSAPSSIFSINIPSYKTPFSCIENHALRTIEEITPPKETTFIDGTNLEEFIIFLEKARKLRNEQRNQLLLSLHWLNQAINKCDFTSKVVSLGISLDTILTKNDKNISYYFRNNGEYLCRNTNEPNSERSHKLSLFKSFYKLRSKAVHEGTVKPTDSSSSSSSSIQNQKKLTNRDLFNKLVELSQIAIKNFVIKDFTETNDVKKEYLEELKKWDVKCR